MIGILLAELLEDMGHSVCSIATTEDKAVAEAARCHPELMIVDQHLLIGTGRSAVERILRTGPVPCVFMSGTPEYLVRPDANVLQKPFLLRDLVRAIRLVVGDVAVLDEQESAPVMAVPNY